MERGAGCSCECPIQSANIDEDYRHDFRIARVFCEIQGLRVQCADTAERSSQAALTRIFVHGAIQGTVNSESTPAADNEGAVTESLVRSKNPAHPECEFHTGSEGEPHVPGRFLFHIRDRRYITSAEAHTDFLPGDSHQRNGGACFFKVLIPGEYFHFDLLFRVGFHQRPLKIGLENVPDVRVHDWAKHFAHSEQ